FDAGFAGICFPKEYGGQRLTPVHQDAFNEDIWPFEYPPRFQLPTLQPCATVISTTERKNRNGSTSRPSFAVTRSGCSSCLNRRVDPTSPGRRPPPCVMATNGCSTVRRSGRPGRGGRTGGCAWPALT